MAAERIFQCTAVAAVVFAIAGMLWCSLMLVRNDWVYRQRIRMLYRDMRLYERLPSYDAMMRRFWVWRVEDFL